DWGSTSNTRIWRNIWCSLLYTRTVVSVDVFGGLGTVLWTFQQLQALFHVCRHDPTLAYQCGCTHQRFRHSTPCGDVRRSGTQYLHSAAKNAAKGPTQHHGPQRVTNTELAAPDCCAVRGGGMVDHHIVHPAHVPPRGREVE